MPAAKQQGTLQYVYREDGFLVDYVQRQNQYSMAKDHLHDNYEIYYLLSGQRKYFIRDRVYLIEKGDLVFIPKYDLHRTLAADTATHERFVMNFQESFLERFTGGNTNIHLLAPFEKETPTFRLKAEDRNVVEGLLYRMTKELKDKPPGYDICLKALGVELLLYIVRCMGKYEEAVSPFETPMHRKISEIAGYIHEHYMKPLTLSKLSERYYISSWYLSRVFKEVSGFSFVEYLNHVRIKEAQRLLRDTNMKILPISEQVGFESIAHFGRVFKQTVGLSPTRYRRIQSGGQ
jgi:AraC-like DNA-binding protein